MKRIVSLLVSAVMLFAMTATTFADPQYVITMDLESTDETYCSKLVWQAYYYGHTPSAANGPTWGVRLPYSLPDTIHNLDLVQEWL